MRRLDASLVWEIWQQKVKPGDVESRRERNDNERMAYIRCGWLEMQAERERMQSSCVPALVLWMNRYLSSESVSEQCYRVDLADLSLSFTSSDSRKSHTPRAALLSLHYGSDWGEIRLCHWPGRHIHRCVCPAAWWSRESPETAVPGPPELQRRSHRGDPQSPGRGNVTGWTDELIHTFLEY